MVLLIGGQASTGFSLGERWFGHGCYSLFVYIARFLAAIAARRTSLLWRTSKSLSPAEDMAALEGTEA